MGSMSNEICTPLTYENLVRFTEGKNLPATAVNQDDENVIVSDESQGTERVFRLDTMQKNDWIRINWYYPDGSIDETYER